MDVSEGHQHRHRLDVPDEISGLLVQMLQLVGLKDLHILDSGMGERQCSVPGGNARHLVGYTAV